MSLFDDVRELGDLFGPEKPTGVISPQLSQEIAMTNALRNALGMHYQVEAGRDMAGSLMERIFPSDSGRRNKDLVTLEIAERRKRLGLPNDTEDYEELLNRNKTVSDPGRSLMWAGMALSKKPLLRYGASPIFKGEYRGKSLINSIFG